MIIIFLAVFCLSLVSVFAYSGTLNIGRIAANGNNSNYAANIFDGVPTGLHEANSSNYTVRFEAYDYAMEENIVPPVVEDDDPPSRSSSSTSSTSTWPTTPSTTEPVIKDISYGVLVSSKNKSILVENKQKLIVLQSVEIKLIDNLRGEKTNLLVQITQVGETKTRKESLSFFGYQYEMLEINHEDLQNEDIKSAKISFSVRDTWLQEHNIQKEDVYLYRYVNGEWQELKTVYEEDNRTHHFYSALSPGLSSFMIGTREEVVNQEKPLDQNIITGNAVGENNTNNNDVVPENTTTGNNETSEETGFLQEKMFFGLSNALSFLIGGILLAVIILAGVGLAMKHNHIHSNRKEEDYQQILPSQVPTQQAPIQQKKPAQSVETDFVDTLVGHVDAKAQEIAQQVTNTVNETQTPSNAFAQLPKEKQQTPARPQIKTTSVREKTATSQQASVATPEELDFTGHEEEALIHYVKQVMSSGYAKELYTKALLAKGWTQVQIEHCIHKVMEEQVQAPSRTTK